MTSAAGAFAFQLDDGRLAAPGLSGGEMLTGSSLGRQRDWIGVGGAEGIDDPEGVHKRSLNGTSKGVSPAAGRSMGTSSPRDEGDLIRRVACDESPGVMQQQLPQVIKPLTACMHYRPSPKKQALQAQSESSGGIRLEIRERLYGS